ncbi:ATP-binding protein [Marichromatium purpuratum 984]|uniref:ATP-binding protein n=1 Tax=Marichromatium purpuratum 984 TaxID=765910 RepID=W0DZZ4_MARPU|nr:ATP-binding cassette domain-containing protein [Marichromatium purpuratum]AHF02431.1 ATP-binding protein [Marichromatium purpuratum 984]
MGGLRVQGLGNALFGPIDLAVGGGERVFLSGPSGCGKSLLLRAIADLDPHRGEAWLDDVPRSRLPAPLWRRRVGLLPAESAWWGESVGEHLPATHPPLDDWLSVLGFGPEVLDWPVARLSTGERQRLALLRLLAQSPRALLLDEATANLDPQNCARVEGLIEDYRAAHRTPVLWVSHDPAQRRRLGDRRLSIRDGRLEPEDIDPS